MVYWQPKRRQLWRNDDPSHVIVRRKITTRELRHHFLRIHSLKIALMRFQGRLRETKEAIAREMEIPEIDVLRQSIVKSGLLLSALTVQEIFAAIFLVSEQCRRARKVRGGYYERFIKNHLQSELLLRSGVKVRLRTGRGRYSDDWELSYGVWKTHITGKALGNIAWFLNLNNVEMLEQRLEYLERTT